LGRQPDAGDCHRGKNQCGAKAHGFHISDLNRMLIVMETPIAPKVKPGTMPCDGRTGLL
jgi:hypothetical protein